MLTLYITGLVVAIFLVPGIVFRGFFSLFLPLRRFQRTRTEEIAFAVKVCAVPFAIVTTSRGSQILRFAFRFKRG
jgi:hypothetical protein